MKTPPHENAMSATKEKETLTSTIGCLEEQNQQISLAMEKAGISRTNDMSIEHEPEGPSLTD